MNKLLVKFVIISFAYLAVLYPLWVRISGLDWTADYSLNLFPLFGLAAFAILWLHSISGVFESWLRKNFDFDSYVHYTSVMVLVFMILHPLLLFIGIKFNFNELLSSDHADDIRLGVIGLILLLTYDIGKVLKKYKFFVENWNNILIISTIGFLFTFFHSLELGSDLQFGPLRVIWIFYGVTAILATIYTYGIKRFLRQN